MRDGRTDDDFRSRGVVQQFGAVFVRLCRLTDTALVVAMLFLVFAAGWESPHPIAVEALLCIAILELIASFSHLSRSWRINRLRHELAKLTVYWTACFVA